MKDLINWKALSRYLAGNDTSVSRSRCPKKYQPKVNSLIECLKEWEEKNIKTDDSDQNKLEDART